jgi:hypothetical protein
MRLSAVKQSFQKKRDATCVAGPRWLRGARHTELRTKTTGAAAAGGSPPNYNYGRNGPAGTMHNTPPEHKEQRARPVRALCTSLLGWANKVAAGASKKKRVRQAEIHQVLSRFVSGTASVL